TDQFGIENSRTCAFLVSEHWTSESSFMDGAVSLELRQAAIDDGNANDIDSLNDLLYRVLNSQGLVDTLETALRDANPLKPYACDQQVCIPLIGCSCVFSSGVDYRNNTLAINGPNTTSLSLVTNGLRAQATVRNVSMGFRVRTSVLGTINGTASLSSLSLDLIFDLFLQNNQPRAQLRSSGVGVGTVSV